MSCGRKAQKEAEAHLPLFAAQCADVKSCQFPSRQFAICRESRNDVYFRWYEVDNARVEQRLAGGERQVWLKRTT